MLRTPVFKLVLIGAAALLVLAFALGTTGAQPAQAANATQVSAAGWMPLAGSLYDPSSASARGYVFTYRGKSAAAAFYNFDGCIETEVLVLVADEIFHDPLYFERSTSSNTDIFIYQADLCAGSELIFANTDGFARLESSDFHVDSRLSTATLDATVTLFNYVTSEYFDVDVDLTWTANSPVISQNSNNHYDFPGCRMELRKRGSERLAEVSGTITDGITNFTPEPTGADPRTGGEISLVQQGFVFIGCN